MNFCEVVVGHVSVCMMYNFVGIQRD